MNIRDILLVILFCLVLLAWGCDPGSDSPDPQPRLNPVPQLTAVSPTESVSHMPAFTLTATGSDFISSSVIVFNGVEMDTEYVGATELRCVIQPDDTAAAPAGIQAASTPHAKVTHMDVWVRTPAPGGGDSGTLDFLVLDNHEFSPPRIVSGVPAPAKSPCLVVTQDGVLHLVWLDCSAASIRTAYARSPDEGGTWVRSSTFHFPAFRFGNHALAFNSEGHLAAVWTTSTRAVFSRSLNGGNTWSQPVVATESEDVCPESHMRRSSVALDERGIIYIAFSLNHSPYIVTSKDDQIWFCRSVDDGATWSCPINISRNRQLVPSFVPGSTDILISDEPCLAVDSTGDIHLVWHTKAYSSSSLNNWQTYFSYIFHVFSIDNGLTWSTAVKRSEPLIYAYVPDLKRGGDGCLSLGWHGQDSGNPWNATRSFPCFCGSTSGAWTEPVDLAPEMNNSFSVTHAVDPLGNINVAWQDISYGNEEIYFSRSIDGGLTWTEPLNISNSPGRSLDPVLVCDENGKVFIAWHDNHDVTWKIHFVHSGR